MKDKKPVDEERYNKLLMLEQFENAVLTIAVVSKQLIEEIFKRHKELNVKFNDSFERLAWTKIKDGASSLDHIAFNSPYCNYEKFKKDVLMVKFLILELISRCDDSNMRVWQFHNLLKSFKIVYPGAAPNNDDEIKAFENLFNQIE